MTKYFKNVDNWLGGLQWLMYIFINTVVVPITMGAAFNLSQAEIVSTMQFSFILGGIACLLQVFIGHRRPIMDAHPDCGGAYFSPYLHLQQRRECLLQKWAAVSQQD